VTHKHAISYCQGPPLGWVALTGEAVVSNVFFILPSCHFLWHQCCSCRDISDEEIWCILQEWTYIIFIFKWRQNLLKQQHVYLVKLFICSKVIQFPKISSWNSVQLQLQEWRFIRTTNFTAKISNHNQGMHLLNKHHCWILSNKVSENVNLKLHLLISCFNCFKSFQFLLLI
jgi:hypothetical protein